MNKPFFSIIVPVYNVEKYLPICLESVLRQSFTDYEIILVDDGSTDSSGQVCDDYAARYSDRIWVHHKQNQGQISARIDGLKLANGDYVCFLDSDDCWSDYSLNRLHEVIESTNTDVILFRWERIDENGKSLNEPIPSFFPESGFIDKKIVFEKMLSTSLLNALWSKCCKLSLFDINMDFSTGILIPIDDSEKLAKEIKDLIGNPSRLAELRSNLKSMDFNETALIKEQFRSVLDE